MMEPYGVSLSFELLGTRGHCDVRACAYPGFGIVLWDHWSGQVGQRFVCWWHFLVGASPFSLEYEDADALLGVPRHRSRSWNKDAAIGAIVNHHWNPARIKKYQAKGFSHKAAVAAVNHCAKRDGQLTHCPDPIYHAFQTVRGIVYSRCGERVESAFIVARGSDPTCSTCKRMRDEAIALLPPTPGRPGIITAPRKREESLSFIEKLETEGLESDSAAFESRRNWGERSGRAWNDKSKGVQRDSRLRWDRGGVNRKRG